MDELPELDELLEEELVEELVVVVVVDVGEVVLLFGAADCATAEVAVTAVVV